MDQALWSFLRNSPETSVPFPWERCFDFRTEILFYRNRLNGTVVIDLRSHVNLGGGLFHLSNMWHDLTCSCCNNHQHHHHRRRSLSFLETDQYNQDPPFVISASCCGPLVYLLVPEMVHLCPICDCHIFYIS